MVSIDSTLEEIKDFVKSCLRQLYDSDAELFIRNKAKGVCERCIVFRFAHYLQNEVDGFWVDCDFNSSYEGYLDSEGNIVGNEVHGKPITNTDNTITKRYIDIIVHNREPKSESDFICFEIKKWTNNSAKEKQKDFNNLRVLTTEYGYKFGFHIILGRTKNKSKWTIFQNGQPIIDNQLIFNNE